MRSQIGQKRAESGKTPAPAAAQEATTGEFPIAIGEAETEDDGDLFKEIPTVANRANPTDVASAGDAGAPSMEGQHEGVGTYRLVRPTTSDVIDTPAPSKGDPNDARRLIIGGARKPR